METIFLVCAVVGGTLLVCQFVLGLLGFGHHDVDHDFHGGLDHADGHDHAGEHDPGQGYTSWFAGVLTFRALVAAVTFFGLAGMAASTQGLGAPLSLGVAIAAAVAAIFLVAFVMRSLGRLRADGTLRIERAVGRTGTVSLSVPGRKSGAGKVHLKLQNRIVEYRAVTNLDELPTGAQVVVVSVAAPGTVEVAATAAPNPEGITHAS